MSNEKKSYKVGVYGCNTFINVGTGKDGKPYASMAAVKIRKKDNKTEEWGESPTWFLNDAYAARALLDKAIAFMEDAVSPVEEFVRGEGGSRSSFSAPAAIAESTIDDDDIPF